MEGVFKVRMNYIRKRHKNTVNNGVLTYYKNQKKTYVEQKGSSNTPTTFGSENVNYFTVLVHGKWIQKRRSKDDSKVQEGT